MDMNQDGALTLEDLRVWQRVFVEWQLEPPVNERSASVS